MARPVNYATKPIFERIIISTYDPRTEWYTFENGKGKKVKLPTDKINSNNRTGLVISFTSKSGKKIKLLSKAEATWVNELLCRHGKKMFK
jgi:predicted type IV restriction endonuclease